MWKWSKDFWGNSLPIIGGVAIPGAIALVIKDPSCWAMALPFTLGLTLALFGMIYLAALPVLYIEQRLRA